MIKSATAVKAKMKNKAGGNSDKSQIMLYQLLNSCFALNPGVYLHLEIFLKNFDVTIDITSKRYYINTIR